MELRDISMDDLPLYRALLTDEATMAELGGPLPGEPLEDKLRDIVRDVRAGTAWFDVIVSNGEPVGTVCIWDHDEDGEPITEIGWMVLPAFQGRGLASGAVRAIVERVRARRRWKVIHAFPGVTNAPSNAICRTAGFELVGEQDIGYLDRTLRCNHWVLDLRTAS